MLSPPEGGEAGARLLNVSCGRLLCPSFAVFPAAGSVELSGEAAGLAAVIAPGRSIRRL